MAIYRNNYLIALKTISNRTSAEPLIRMLDFPLIVTRSSPLNASCFMPRTTISEYARIDVPNIWDHGRNPVRYTSLDELAKDGITLEGIEFQPMPVLDESGPAEAAQPAPNMAREMTIEDAKKGLAATFGVKPEAVEITIRG